MSGPGHTPINVIEGAGSNGFSDRCATLLIRAGYSPDDFGSYDKVRGDLAAARTARQQYLQNCAAAGTTPDPNGPDARTAFLARCQAGHLTQDATFRHPNHPTTVDGLTARGNACANHTPQANGYDTNLAPCMPHPTNMGPSANGPGDRGARGSNHHAIGANERAQADAQASGSGPGTQPPLTQAQLSNNCQQNATTATTNQPTNTADAQANRRAADINQSRQASAAELEARARAGGQGAGGAGGTGPGGTAGAGGAGGGSIDGSTVEECIDKFRQRGLEQMRQQVIDKYDRNYDSTMATAQSNRTQAQAAAAAAQTRANASQQAYQDSRDRTRQLRADRAAAEANARANPGDAAAQQAAADARAAHQASSAATRQAGSDANRDIRAAGRANTDAARAEQEVRNVDCLRAQAQALQQPPQPPPPITGFPPGSEHNPPPPP